MADVPITQPAIVQKNPDGTYSVRIQHHDSGIVSEVHFPNVVFAETMANAYAAFINGLEKAETAVEEAVPVIKEDVKKITAAAKKEAADLTAKAESEFKKIVESAETEAVNLKKGALQFVEDARVEANKMLADAKAEAEKLIADAKAEIAKLSKKTPATKPPTVIDDEL